MKPIQNDTTIVDAETHLKEQPSFWKMFLYNCTVAILVALALTVIYGMVFR